MASIGRSGIATSGQSRVVERMDWPLFISVALLIFMGLMSQWSIAGGLQGSFFRKQAINVAIGIVPFSIFAVVHPKVWRRGSSWLYAFDILALLAVLVVGKHTKGAERWIPLPGGVQFQPSELAKLLTTLTLGAFYAHRQDEIDKLSTFLLGLAHVGVPMLLILKQPHLGAALVLLVMWFAVSLLAGVPLKYLGGFAAFVIVLGIGAFSVPSVRGMVLHGYQANRIAGIEAKTKDVRGRNWQTDRAEIAFGVGGVTGSGFMQGEQKQAGFIPEQHNDFVVTVIGEEGGLIGCSLLLATYAFFFFRIFLIMLHASEPFYKMVAGGLFAMLGFHTFVNIAMVLQLLPVVGLWLPFLSYGGTAMWLCLASAGLLLNLKRRERPLLF